MLVVAAVADHADKVDLAGGMEDCGCDDDLGIVGVRADIADNKDVRFHAGGFSPVSGRYMVMFDGLFAPAFADLSLVTDYEA